MKFLKKRDYEGTVRKVVDDERTIVYGVVGTVRDMMAEKVILLESGLPDDDEQNRWCCVRPDFTMAFGDTREMALRAAGIRE